MRAQLHQGVEREEYERDFLSPVYPMVYDHDCIHTHPYNNIITIIKHQQMLYGC